MRSRSEIVQANKDAEAKEKRNDAEDQRAARAHDDRRHVYQNIQNRCKACAEPVEDCVCERLFTRGTR